MTRLVGLSYALGPSMNLVTVKSFYYALVQSQLSYGIVFWGEAFDININILQIF